MNCEKCGKGEMVPGKVYRLGGCLVVIGYTLWLPAVLLLILTTIFAFVGTKATGEAFEGQMEKAKVEAIGDLEEIYELPEAVLDDFKDDGTIAPETLDLLV